MKWSKRLTTGLLLCVVLPLTLAWFGGTEGDPIVILSVCEWVAITNATPNAATNPWDVGDSNPESAERYHGDLPLFSGGGPLVIRTWIKAYPPAVHTNYAELRLEYHKGAGPTADTNWVTIATIGSGFDILAGTEGAHFGAFWTPPCTTSSPAYATNYLIRVHAQLEDGTESSDLEETGIVGDGNVGTWSDLEVIDVHVTANRRPGYELQ